MCDPRSDRVLIIGGTGSLGRKLIERLLPHHEVAVLSRDEAKHWTIRNEMMAGRPASDLRFYVGDIRDRGRIEDVIRQYLPGTIIVAAALKQVDTCELSPDESVMTNLIGTQNVVAAVNRSQLPPHSVLFVSTDKACSPVNVYGMCKAISERIVTSQARGGRPGVRFLAVRYGNVLESRGSIIPLFKHQGMHCQQLTVTDPNMTRFLMTLDDSVNLIEAALKDGASGQTWVPLLPAMRIGDLAEIFATKYSKTIKVIGLRPGEKLHEDLINESESVRTEKHRSGRYHIIQPAFISGANERFTCSSSSWVMSPEQLLQHLTALGVVDAPLERFKGLLIEEIATNRQE